MSTRISFLPHRKHNACPLLMLSRKKNAVCSNNRAKYINKPCGKKHILLFLQQVVCWVTTGLEAVKMSFSKLYFMLHGKRLSRQIVILILKCLLVLSSTHFV